MTLMFLTGRLMGQTTMVQGRRRTITLMFLMRKLMEQTITLEKNTEFWTQGLNMLNNSMFSPEDRALFTIWKTIEQLQLCLDVQTILGPRFGLGNM